MREYLLGILCAAFLCAIVTSVGGAGQGTRKLICGVFLALSVLHPLGSFDLPELSLDPILEEARDAARDGQTQALAAKTDIITDALEAYILSKASELDLTVEAAVTLTADGLPDSVTLTGPASPWEREQLSGAITAALGLGKEDIRWKEIRQSSE